MINCLVVDRLKFESVYVAHYSRMKRFAREYVVRDEDAENIVQDVFMDLWEKNLLLNTHSNLFSFLFTSVKNRCVDFLRRATVAKRASDYLQQEHDSLLELKLCSLESFDNMIFDEANLESVVQCAIDSLPEKCRQIFILSKIEGKKQRVIAEELNISINTVENQMAIANKKLKEMLKEFVPLLFSLLF